MSKAAIVLFVLAGTLTAAWAQNAMQPAPLPMPAPIPAPQDVAYPGTVRLAVDATDLVHGIFRVHETVPVARAGDMVLLYPEWLPGHHSPTGTLDKFAGLTIHSGNNEVPWTRDVVDVYALHVAVPKGAQALDVDFQFLSPVEAKEGRIEMTPEMLNLEWNSVALYPAGYYARRIMFAPTAKLPAGWKFGTALETQSAAGETVAFKPVDFDTLVDSPLFAGRYFERVDLDPGAKAQVHMDIVADQPNQLPIKPEQLQIHRNLVQQAYRLFGSHHYDHYDFLLALTERMGGIGLEHHRSSEDGTSPKYFTHWDKTIASRDLLSHEFTHSWNGKFRRPADLWTPNFNVPMRDSLLWVYEGQTQYWGFVLASRSGLWTKQQGLDAIASDAATYATRAGRSWRPLQDTTNDPIISQRRPIPWRSWQRSEDYYGEGLLIWLDADTLIRQKTGGKKSLDDVARAFFGINDGSFVPVTYTFDDIVKALNGVLPYDWASFLKARLAMTDAAPLDGLARGGYRLVYADKPSEYSKSSDEVRKQEDLSYSIGLVANHKGAVTDVAWDGPAAKAGVTVGSEIIAVNGTAFDPEDLKDAITDAKMGAAPIQLLLKRDTSYTMVSLNYHGGLRYPHLEPVANAPPLLDAILSPRNN